MSTRVTALVTTLLLCSATSAFAAGAAWQEPGFVMEEVVASAPAPVRAEELAWQALGYVMEEVVVVADAQDVLAAAQARVSARARALFAAHLRHLQLARASEAATSGI